MNTQELKKINRKQRGRPRKTPAVAMAEKEKADQDRFLDLLEIYGTIGRAFKESGVTIMDHRRWLTTSQEYREQFAIVQTAIVAQLEDEAFTRAVRGVPRKMFYKGKPIIDRDTGKQYVEYEYSDRLLEFLLRANCPEKYSEKVSHEHTGKGGGPIQNQHMHLVVRQVLQELDRREIMGGERAGDGVGPQDPVPTLVCKSGEPGPVADGAASGANQ